MTDKEYLAGYDGPPLRIMEVCGTHTSAIFKSGIRSFLSPKIRLVSGPGCPVCVTVPDYIDRCIEISMTPGHELVCFGDLLKIPGTGGAGRAGGAGTDDGTGGAGNAGRTGGAERAGGAGTDEGTGGAGNAGRTGGAERAGAAGMDEGTGGAGNAGRTGGAGRAGGAGTDDGTGGAGNAGRTGGAERAGAAGVTGRIGNTLSDAKGAGGHVRMAWSPFDAIAAAQSDPATTFVVAAIGFETTAPAFGLLLEEAEACGLRNLRLLPSLKSALAAIDWICAAGEEIDAFLCPGHVSVVTGADAYIPLAEKYKKPFIVAGFEGEHLLAAVRAAAEDAAEGRAAMRNLYPEAVSAQGNQKAREVTERYFSVGDAAWRGLGRVPGSGYFLRDDYRMYDACGDARICDAGGDGRINDAGGSSRAYDAGGAGRAYDAGDAGQAYDAGDAGQAYDAGDAGQAYDAGGNPPLPISGMNHKEDIPEGCRCGDVILGRIDPDACPLFGAACTPTHAIGPCMVSSEGACGVWYRNRQ